MQNGKQVNLAEATFALQRKMLKEVTKLWQLKTDTTGLSYFKISELVSIEWWNNQTIRLRHSCWKL